MSEKQLQDFAKIKRTSLPKKQRKWGTLAAMSLGYGVVQLDVTIVNTAINSIGSTIGGGVAALQWIVNTYTIAFAAIILTAGALGDRIGAKRVFIAGFSIFTFASLACAAAPGLAVLIIARAVQGLGAAILVPNSLALLNHSFSEEKERGRAVAIWAAGASVALTAGPLAGGILSGAVGWRSIFLVNLPIGLAGLWLTWRYTTDTPRAANREIDLPGQATSILALGLLAAAMIEGGQLGWLNPLVVSGLAMAIVFLLLFVRRERRTKQPMLPLRFFSDRTFTVSTATGVMVNIAFYGLIFVLSLYFQRVDRFSPLMTGLAFIPMMGVVLPTNLIAPRVSERIGAPLTITIGGGIAAAGAVALLGIGHETSFWAMFPQLLALGGGLGFLVPPLTSILLGTVDKAHSGIASGVLNSARQTGSVIGVALFGSLLQASGGLIAGAHLSLIISAALLVASGIIMLGAGLARRT